MGKQHGDGAQRVKTFILPANIHQSVSTWDSACHGSRQRISSTKIHCINWEIKTGNAGFPQYNTISKMKSCTTQEEQKLKNFSVELDF